MKQLKKVADAPPLVTVLDAVTQAQAVLASYIETSDTPKRAQARGVPFGRPPKLTGHQRLEAIARLAGETQAEVARSYNVDATTIGRISTKHDVGRVSMGRA
jgi:hypothetical protein